MVFGQYGQVNYATMNYLQDLKNVKQLQSSSSEAQIELLPYEMIDGSQKFYDLTAYKNKHNLQTIGNTTLILNKPEINSTSDAYLINAIKLTYKERVYEILILQYHYIDLFGEFNVLIDSDFNLALNPNKDNSLKYKQQIELTDPFLGLNISYEVPEIFSLDRVTSQSIDLNKRNLKAYNKSEKFLYWVDKQRRFVPYLSVELNVLNGGKGSLSISQPLETRTYDWKYNGGSITFIGGLSITRSNSIYFKYSIARIEPADYTIKYLYDGRSKTEYGANFSYLPRREVNYGFGALQKIFLSDVFSTNIGLEYLFLKFPNSTFEDFHTKSTIITPKLMLEYHISKDISYYFGIDYNIYQYELNDTGIEYFRNGVQAEYKFNDSKQSNLSFNLGMTYAF